MSAGPVHLKGSTQFTRTHGRRRHLLQHETEVVLHERSAVLRFTSDETGLSETVPISDRETMYMLRRVDAAMLRTCRRRERVETRFKPKRRRRAVETAPPAGWVWCPMCLGDLELAPTCERCDGERIVRRPLESE